MTGTRKNQEEEARKKQEEEARKKREEDRKIQTQLAKGAQKVVKRKVGRSSPLRVPPGVSGAASSSPLSPSSQSPSSTRLTQSGAKSALSSSSGEEERMKRAIPGLPSRSTSTHNLASELQKRGSEVSSKLSGADSGAAASSSPVLPQSSPTGSPVVPAGSSSPSQTRWTQGKPTVTPEESLDLIGRNKTKDAASSSSPSLTRKDSPPETGNVATPPPRKLSETERAVAYNDLQWQINLHSNPFAMGMFEFNQTEYRFRRSMLIIRSVFNDDALAKLKEKLPKEEYELLRAFLDPYFKITTNLFAEARERTNNDIKAIVEVLQVYERFDSVSSWDANFYNMNICAANYLAFNDLIKRLTGNPDFTNVINLKDLREKKRELDIEMSKLFYEESKKTLSIIKYLPDDQEPHARKRVEFLNFEAQKLEKSTGACDLSDFFIQPLQRIARYEGLFETSERNFTTPEGKLDETKPEGTIIHDVHSSFKKQNDITNDIFMGAWPVCNKVLMQLERMRMSLPQTDDFQSVLKKVENSIKNVFQMDPATNSISHVWEQLLMDVTLLRMTLETSQLLQPKQKTNFLTSLQNALTSTLSSSPSPLKMIMQLEKFLWARINIEKIDEILKTPALKELDQSLIIRFNDLSVKLKAGSDLYKIEGFSYDLNDQFKQLITVMNEIIAKIKDLPKIDEKEGKEILKSLNSFVESVPKPTPTPSAEASQTSSETPTPGSSPELKERAAEKK